MGKKRIYELAKEINVSSKDIIAKAKASGFDVKNHMSTLGENEERQIRQSFATKNNQKSETPKKKPTMYRSAKTGKTVVERASGHKQETSVQHKTTQTSQRPQETKSVNNNHKTTEQTHNRPASQTGSNRPQHQNQSANNGSHSQNRSSQQNKSRTN